MGSFKSSRRTSAAAQLLRSLESRLIALDEALLLGQAASASPGAAGLQPASPKPRLAFHGVDQPTAPQRRLKFTALPPEVDRVVVQNWNPHSGFIPLGDVELELDPGQAVTLWMNRMAPTPLCRQDEQAAPSSSLYILCEDQRLLV